jgi:ComF family protein
MCHRCGAPFACAIVSFARVCVKCDLDPPRFNKAMSMWMFNGVAREIVHELKYRSGEHMLPDIERMVSKNRAIVDLISNAILVPVPIHWRKLFSRGYNQSELIAKALCKITTGSVVKNLLIKKKYNKSQTELTSEDRTKNVADAFDVQKNMDLEKNAKIVIVDDVMTTGATINECVKRLNDRGYFNVSVVTLARD